MTQETTQNGRVVWHDCMTTDIDKSIEFYSKLFGWTTQDFDPGETGAPYKLILSGDAMIGGFVQMETSLPGTPPSRWVSYVSVDDVDASAARTTAAGGKICVPPCDIPTIGRFAVVEDPTGGTIATFKSEHESPPAPEGPAPVGEFIWEELLTSDPAAATSFYGELFGWKSETMDMGEMGDYHVQSRGAIPEAGIMKKQPGDPGPSHWLSYVHVEDVDASAARANELGGTTVVEPMDIPNIGRMSVHNDSVGTMFALYKPVPCTD